MSLSVPTAVPRAATDRGLAVASIVASVFGLWTSLQYCFGYWFLSADVTNVATLWDGFRQYGWQFLHTYTYNPDNWLFSLVLPEFLYFYLFDPPPVMVVMVGWFIFVASVAVALLITYRLAGRRAVLAVAPVLLLVSQAAIGNVGSYAQPVCHNISLFWGLAATYAGMRWLAVGRMRMLAASAFMLFIAAVSDPWTSAAFSVPMVVAGAGVAALPGRSGDRRAALALAMGSFAAGLLAATRVFGLLGFLPASGLAFADLGAILQHIRLLGAVLTLLFDMLPGHDVMQYQPGAPSLGLTIVTCAVLAVVTVASLVALLRRFGVQPVAVRFGVAVAVLSCGATIGAFCLTNYVMDLASGRYLVNVGMFLPMLVATAVALLDGRWGVAPRRVALTLGALLALTGAISDPHAWARGLPYSEDFHYRELAAFLRSQGLSYGYGSYFGSNAGTFTWLSRGEIIMRPLWIDAPTGFVHPGEQTSPLWFRPEDRPAGPDRTFLVIHGDCTTVDICIAGATRQFGAPEHVVTFQDSTVLIWPHPLRWPS